MLRTLRIGLIIALSIPVANSQEVPGGARTLEKTLADLDDELHRLEQLVKLLSPNGTTAAALNLLSAQESYQRGRMAEDRHDYELAVDALNKAIQFDPRNEAALLHRGHAYFEMGNLEMALADLTQSLALQPDNSHALELRAKVHRARKAYDDATRDLQAAARLDPANASLILAQASLAEEKGDLQAALDLYATALTLSPIQSPASLEIRFKRAAVLRKANRLGEALNECTGTIALDGTSASGYICRAETYLRLGQMQPAIQDLDQAMRLNPMAVEAGPVISAIWRETQLRAAAAQLNPAPAATVPAAPLPVRAAVAEASVPKPEPTVASAEPAAAIRRVSTETDRTVSAKQAVYYATKGRDQIAQERYEKAIVDLTKAIELNPDYSQAYNSRGYAYLRVRDYERAIADFTAAIRLNAKYANAYLNRGSARMRMGDDQGAKEDFHIAHVLAAAIESQPKPVKTK